MKQELKDELAAYLKGVTEIFFTIKDTYLIALRLKRPENEPEFVYLQNDEHYGLVVFSLWKVAQIEICKLSTCGRNQHYNLVDLIKLFEPGGKYADERVTPDLLKKWKDGFIALEKPIQDIKKLRDMSFAHTDAGREEELEKIRITVSDFEAILGLTAVIIRDIKIAVFEDDALLVTPLETKENLILPRLSYAWEMEQRDTELAKKLRGDFTKD